MNQSVNSSSNQANTEKKPVRTIQVNNEVYDIGSLEEAAQQLVSNLQANQLEVRRLKTQRDFALIASKQCANALKPHLPEKPAHANKKKNIVVVERKKYNLDDFDQAAERSLAAFSEALEQLKAIDTALTEAQTTRTECLNALKQHLPEPMRLH